MEAEARLRRTHHQGLQLDPPAPGIPGLDVVRALHQGLQLDPPAPGIPGLDVVRALHQGLQLDPPAPGIPGLDVVRALHQTVISLRTALDSSKEELRRLKESIGEFSGENYAETVERLALENHVLRRRILNKSAAELSSDAATSPLPQLRLLPPEIDERQSPTELTGVAVMETTGDKVGVQKLSEAIKQPATEETEDPECAEELQSSASTGHRRREISTSKRSSSTCPSSPQRKTDSSVEKPTDESSNVDGGKLASGNVALADRNQRVDEGKKSTEDEKCSSSVSEVETRYDTSKERHSQHMVSPVTVVDHLDVPDRDPEDLSLKSISEGDNSVFSDCQESLQQKSQQHLSVEHSKPNDQSENESEELDDIELIFTTDDTCRDLGLQEDLVSITETENWQQNSSPGQPVLLKYTKSAEGETLICNGEKTSSVEEAVSSQSSSIDREESVDRFDESSSTRLNKMWSQCSVLVETDISKCGVVEEPESSSKYARRNTLAAPPTAYRPIIHREALAGGRRKSSTPLRPVMDRSSGARRESGAQTDISALPAQWRSESYLAHKVAHTFTTLPSKFALPAGVPGRLRLSDKTREARRVMLSDISFTSMVPELSRSADHLCHEPHAQTCFASRGCGLRTPEVHRRESLGSHAGYWPRCNLGTGLPSPCDCRVNADLYSSRYRGSLSSIPSPGLEVVGGPSRRHSWRANATSFDTWRVPVPTTTARTRPTWSSMPSSPTHVHPPSTSTKTAKNLPKRTRSKITFQDCPMTRGSVPNLRTDLVGGDNSGGSTESLIDEAEDYLRRSIDSMLTISSMDYWNAQTAYRRRRTRRHSEPDLVRQWNPSQDAKPYLPKIPGDLKVDHLVKVISPEGSVLQGRVRYVGPVLGREDVHVGVELPYDNGSSDGTFHGRRFFDCEPDRAIFVPFKKVVLAWCTT